MTRRLTVTLLGITALTASIAFAQTTTPDTKKPATKTPPATATDKTGEKKMELPPGMTEADMQACMEAGTPGPMHAFLNEGVGVWTGKTTMWMTPEAEPAKSECKSTVTPMMDGRFVKCEMAGEMPGMGPFNGFGIYGYDNVAKTFQSTWIDNCGTGIMYGKGELSSDKKTLTWTFTYNCPITKKQTTMREVERIVSADKKTMEMHGVDPKSGKEFKMMEIELTRTSRGATAAVGTTR
jgi:hypothetical protein